MAEETVLVRYEENDDHGHSTLVLHGDPEVIEALMLLVTATLAVSADLIEGIPGPDDEIEGLGDEPSLAESA